MDRLPSRGALLLCLALPMGCAPAEEATGPHRIELVNVDPAPGSVLRLNDEVRLTFSETLDPTSVTHDSVRLVDEATGDLARGRWVPDGRTLRFVPAGIRSRDLTGGGYTPGARLSLSVGGFPRVSALRSEAGETLDRTVALSFDVSPAGPGQAPLRDPSPDITYQLYIRPADPGSPDFIPLEPGEALRVACKEPLDPRTLRPGEFEIVMPRSEECVLLPRQGSLGGAATPPPIAVRSLALERNAASDGAGDPDWLAEDAAALLLVTPERPLPIPPFGGPYEFHLRLTEDTVRPTLADFSGGSPYRLPVPFLVARFDASNIESDEAYEFEFIDADDFAPLPDRAADGTAHWSGDGRLRIRMPRAAGDGGAGRVTLDGVFPEQSLEATRIELAAGARCELQATGLVVLASQGRIDLDGQLVRRLQGGVEAPPEMWSPEELLRRGVRGPTETLSRWLERARRDDRPWTVIIAGGDLVIHGDVEVDTPLLLVAGGRVRGARAPRVPGGQLWILGEGGFDRSAARSGPSSFPLIPPPLTIDEPATNRLAAPLTFVAYSSPAPKSRVPRHYRRARVTSLDGPHGEARVSFIPVDLPPASGPGTEVDAGQAIRHDQPMGVVESGDPGVGARVRLRLELVARPGVGPWQPPFIDRVLLSWRPSEAQR